MRAKLSEREVAMLQVEAIVSGSSVRKWAKGEKVTSLTDTRIRKAAAKLGIALLG